MFFNSIHKRLQVTLKIEKNNQLDFVDVKLIKDDNKIIFNLYKKIRHLVDT